jgi:hypothetical protein
MQGLVGLYHALFMPIAFSPPPIAAVGITATREMLQRRWPVLGLVFSAMVLAMPVCLWGRGLLDPLSIERPGPGDGLVVLLWVVFLFPLLIYYTAYAWINRRFGSTA